MSEIDAHAATSPTLCSEPFCTDWADAGQTHCRRHRSRALRPLRAPEAAAQRSLPRGVRDYLTLAECAAEFRVSPSTAKRWIEREGIIHVRLSQKLIRVDRASWEAWVARKRGET